MNRTVTVAIAATTLVATVLIAQTKGTTAPASRPAATVPLVRADESATRAEVQKVVRAYVQAVNSADASAVIEFFSRDPNVSTVTEGSISRGWEAIRNEADDLLGLDGEFKVTLGSTDVVMLGPQSALAVAPCAIAVKVGETAVKVRGAITLVLTKAGNDWKIVHEHSSIEEPEDNTSGGVGR